MSKTETAKLGAEKTVRKFFSGSIKLLKADAEGTAKVFRFTASTAAFDRAGDSIKQDGWMLDNFRKNPVIPFGHDYYKFPVGKAVDVAIRSGNLEVDVEFAKTEEGQKCEYLVENQFLNAVSVGFIPKEWVYRSQTDTQPGGMDITKAELLEVSIVPVPCHQDALRQLSALGLDEKMARKFMEPEAKAAGEVLSVEEQIALARRNIEAARAARQAEEAAKAQADAAAAEPEKKGLSEMTIKLDAEQVDSIVAECRKMVEDGIATIRAEKAEIAEMQKAGRVLSKKNEGLIKQALEALKEVIEQLGCDDEPMDGEEEDEVKPPVDAEPDDRKAATISKDTAGAVVQPPATTYSASDFADAIGQAAKSAAARGLGRLS